MPWKECHVMDERARFVARLVDGEPRLLLPQHQDGLGQRSSTARSSLVAHRRGATAADSNR